MTRVLSLAGRALEQYDSPNRGWADDPMSAHRGVVLHIAEGTYRGTIAWQLNPDQRLSNGTRVNTCSTWIVGREVGEWAQMVDSDLIAWCQRAGSRTWLSIELAGFLPNAASAWQIEACAQLLAWSAARYRHPIVVAVDPSGWGLGHHSMDRETLGEEWGHDSCPGAAIIVQKTAIVARAREIAGGVGPAQPRGTEMLGKVKDDATVWRSNGIERVAMTDPNALAALRAAGQPLAVFNTAAELADALGPVWTPAPAVVVDVAALAAALNPLLRPGITPGEVEEIVDRELDEQSRAGADMDT